MPRRALDGHCSGDLDGILAYGEGDSAALDELGADVGGVAHGCVGQAAEVTQRSSGSFVANPSLGRDPSSDLVPGGLQQAPQRQRQGDRPEGVPPARRQLRRPHGHHRRAAPASIPAKHHVYGRPQQIDDRSLSNPVTDDHQPPIAELRAPASNAARWSRPLNRRRSVRPFLDAERKTDESRHALSSRREDPVATPRLVLPSLVLVRGKVGTVAVTDASRQFRDAHRCAGPGAGTAMGIRATSTTIPLPRPSPDPSTNRIRNRPLRLSYCAPEHRHARAWDLDSSASISFEQMERNTWMLSSA